MESAWTSSKLFGGELLPRSTMFSSLPDDIILEILQRLPCRSIIRFRIMSKKCNAMLSDAKFLSTLPLKTSGFFYRAHHDKPEVSGCDGYRYHCIRHHEEGNLAASLIRRMSIVSSCNGLLLLRRSDTDSFYVCNPTTRYGAPLPLKSEASVASGIYFDPRVSSHYKVVIIYQTDHLTLKNMIFSSEMGEWIETSSTLEGEHALKGIQARDVVCTERFMLIVLRRTARFLVVDHRDDEMRIEAQPQTLHCCHGRANQVRCPFLYVSSCGSVRLLSTNWSGFCMWERKEDASWEPMHCVHGLPLWEKVGMYPRSVRKGCFHVQMSQPQRMLPKVVKVEEDGKVFIWTGRRMSTYDMSTGARAEFAIRGMTEPTDGYWTPMIPYSPCLVNPCGSQRVTRRQLKKLVSYYVHGV